MLFAGFIRTILFLEPGLTVSSSVHSTQNCCQDHSCDELCHVKFLSHRALNMSADGDIANDPSLEVVGFDHQQHDVTYYISMQIMLLRMMMMMMMMMMCSHADVLNAGLEAARKTSTLTT